MTSLNPKLIHLPKHQRDKMAGAVLEKALRKQYERKNVRVIKGDSIRVIRGEYKGVEGKVEKVDTEHATFHIEGIQREKIRGGQVKVPIHSSKVMVIALNLDDKYRSNKLQRRTKTESVVVASSDKKEEKENRKDEEDNE